MGSHDALRNSFVRNQLTRLEGEIVVVALPFARPVYPIAKMRKQMIRRLLTA